MRYSDVDCVSGIARQKLHGFRLSLRSGIARTRTGHNSSEKRQGDHKTKWNLLDGHGRTFGKTTGTVPIM